jgi:hypothetical protein
MNNLSITYNWTFYSLKEWNSIQEVVLVGTDRKSSTKNLVITIPIYSKRLGIMEHHTSAQIA